MSRRQDQGRWTNTNLGDHLTIRGLGIRNTNPVRLTGLQTQPAIHIQPTFDTPADLGVDLRKGRGGRATTGGVIGGVVNLTPEIIPAEQVPTDQ